MSLELRSEREVWMLQGLRTVGYDVVDMAAAKAWYTELLGFGPYFDQPFYIGFDVGGYELGLHPGEGGATTYWAVADLDAAMARIEGLGAEIVQAPMDVGEGIRVASVRDPFGNPLGLIANPQFRAEAGARVAASGDELSELVVERSVVVEATPREVYDLWASSEGLSRWLVPRSNVDLRVGGRYELLFDDSAAPGLQGSEGCRVLSFLPGELLSFTWNAPPSLPRTRPLHTWVVLRFEEVDGGTRLRLSHCGWPAAGLADADSEWPATFAYFERAWGAVLEALERHLAV